MILEFSDTATPVYEPFNLSVGEKIIYTGGLNYFKESVDGTFFAVNGKTLQKNQIETPLESIRSEKYLPASFRDYEYPIKDPIAWANKYYGVHSMLNPGRTLSRITANFGGHPILKQSMELHIQVTVVRQRLQI